MVRIFLLLLICFKLITCLNAQVKVSFDYDQAAEFTEYQTYQFSEFIHQVYIAEADKQRILKNIRQELNKLGFRESDHPDLFINIHLVTQLQKSLEETENYYGPGGMVDYGWEPTFTSDNIKVNEYIVGTLFIDLIDVEADKLIWQGRGEGTIKEETSDQRRKKRIRRSVSKIMRKYPPK